MPRLETHVLQVVTTGLYLDDVNTHITAMCANLYYVITDDLPSLFVLG